jgi:hypothetical protein
MRRIYHVGVAQNDKRAKAMVEKVGEVDGITLIPLIVHPANHSSTEIKPDIILSYFSSPEELRRSQNLAEKAPVVLLGETFNLVDRYLPLQKNFYFSNLNSITVASILKALFKSMNNVKVEIKNGTTVNLVVSLKGSRVEKLIPTGKRKIVGLSFKEGLILKELLKEPGEIISYERFLDLGIKKENIPVYMSRLRRALFELDPMLVIKSIRNKGYFIYYGL